MELYNYPILLLTIFFIVILYKYYVALNGKIRVFSITSFFCLCYLVFALIGSALMNCMRFDAEDNNGIYSHPSVVFEVWFYTLLGAFFLFVGFSLSHYAFGKVINIKQVHHSFDYKDLTIKSYDVSNKNFRWILCLYFLSVIVLFLYRSQIGEFPLESIFLGLKGSDLALLRSDATNNFSGKLYRYVIFMEVLPIFLLEGYHFDFTVQLSEQIERLRNIIENPQNYIMGKSQEGTNFNIKIQ